MASTDWKKSILSKLGEPLVDIEDFVDSRWRSLVDRLGLNKPGHIAAYRGYGNSGYLWVRGRLLANPPFGGPMEDDDWWDNLRATYQRWESDEIPDAKIELEYAGRKQEVTTDEEGYYSAVFKRDSESPLETVIARHRFDDVTLVGEHRVYSPRPEAEFMLISDVDDTVIHTGITSVLLAAQLTFLHNAKTRKPLEGVGALYRSFAMGLSGEPVNPTFYVSNSAWNMYDLLRDFLNLNELPPGPLLLRDIGLGTDTSDHKITAIRTLMERHPTLPAVFVGDSGQHDAAIYAQLAEECPDRVKAIYIRDVDPGVDSEFDEGVDAIVASTRSLNVPFIRAETSADIAAHAIKVGLLSGSTLTGIRKAVEEDHRRDSIADEVAKK